MIYTLLFLLTKCKCNFWYCDRNIFESQCFIAIFLCISDRKRLYKEYILLLFSQFMRLFLLALLIIAFPSIMSASFITHQRECPIDQTPRLELSGGSYFVFGQSPLWDKDTIEYRQIDSSWSDNSLQSYNLPYNKKNFRSIKTYVTELPGDGPYIWKVISIDALFNNKYLYVGTTNTCISQSYMLNITNKKWTKYPNLDKIIYDNKYFIWYENNGCSDGITITVSNPTNLFDIKRATYNVTAEQYSLSWFAMSGDSTLVVNFERLSWMTGNIPMTTQKTLDLSIINRKNKKQKFFYEEKVKYIEW